MPYAVQRKGSRYQVVNTETGKVHSTTTREKAQKQLRLLQSIERDWQANSDGTYSRTVNGRKVNLKIK